MVQRGEQLDLADEPCGKVLPAGQVRQEHLHGLLTIGDDVADAVDTPHAAAAQLTEHLVVADALVDIHRTAPGLLAGC
jgi:hypothetical protein